MFEQAFKNIDDVLWKEAGCTTELDYTEQASWLLFLKYLDSLEQDLADQAALSGKKYTFILDKPYRWETWAAPKTKDGKLDRDKAQTGDDLRDSVNQKLGFGGDQLAEMQRIIDAEKSDLFDVLAHVAYALPPLTREERAAKAKVLVSTHFNTKQQIFIDFVLSHYVSVGVEELDQEKLTPLLRLKYRDSIADALADLGRPEEIGEVFAGFHRFLYQNGRAA